MKSLNDCVIDYKNALKEGNIQIAYRGIMEFMMGLKTFFKNNYPDFSVPGNIYQGYMDMTYFSLFPVDLKARQLKIAVVLVHGSMKIEVWLAGINKQVQTIYWNKFKLHDFKEYRLPKKLKGEDSIIEFTIDENPNFDNPDVLTRKIEAGTLRFISDIETLLNE